MPKLGRFGDERRILLSDRLTMRQREAALFIQQNPLVIQGASYWHNHRPWRVTARRLPDNFCLFVLDGAVELKTESDTVILRVGDAFLLPSWQTHEFGLPKGVNECRHIILHVVPGKGASCNPIDCLKSVHHRFAWLHAEEEHLLNTLALMDSGCLTVGAGMGEFLNRILMQLAIGDHFHPPTAHELPPKLEAALMFLGLNFQRELSVAQISAAVGIHEAYCRILFRKHLHASPAQYLCQLRLKQAMTLLLTTDKTVKRIAFESGFSNDRYFCYVFRKYFSTSPLEYRKEQTGVP